MAWVKLPNPTTTEDIARDLCKIAGESNLTDSLVALGITSFGDQYELSIHLPWFRSGAETYLAVFGVINKTKQDQETKLALKACVPSSIAIPVEEVLNNWIKRRRFVQAATAHPVTPKLYGYGHGVILEEYIGKSLKEVVGSKGEAIQKTIDLLQVLIEVRFNPKLTFHDFRSRGTDAVIVDFGADLGDPQPESFFPESEFLRFLRNNDVSEQDYASAEWRLLKEKNRRPL